jgi:heme/copper-type cytochrome/quinol oxidase subunit 1
VATFGSYISAISFIYFFYILYLTLANSGPCANNPWVEESSSTSTSNGLEWVLPSPPAFHTYGDQLPVIRPSYQLAA